MEHLRRDVRQAVRRFGAAPWTTLAVVLSLGLGIGVNTAVFSVVNAVFLRGVPVHEPHRVVRIFTEDENQVFQPYLGVSRANYLDVRERAESFSALTGMVRVDAQFRMQRFVEPSFRDEQLLEGLVASANYFDVLGLEADRGELWTDGLSAESGESFGPPVPEVVLSADAWERLLTGHPEPLGTIVYLNLRPFRVVGATPRGFAGADLFDAVDFWVAIEHYSSFMHGERGISFDHRRALFGAVLARLAPDVDPSSAQSELRRIAADLAEEYPDANYGRSLRLLTLDQSTVDANQRSGYLNVSRLFMAITVLVLLIACANVANLLLGQALGRRSELAVRQALGASRGRLLLQLTTESLVLALCGGIVGLGVAMPLRQALWRLRPPDLTDVSLDLSFDLRVFAFVTVMTVLAGGLFGFAPALRAARTSLVREIRQAEADAVGGNRLFSVWNMLILLQAALLLVALIGTGLFLRSLQESLRLDPGFDPEGLILVDLDPGKMGLDAEQREAVFGDVLDAARRVDGVEAASLTSTFPLIHPGGLRRTVFAEQTTAETKDGFLVPVITIEPNYPELLGIPILEGRALDAGDGGDAPLAVLANQAAADLFWPGEDPLGKRFHFHGQEEQVRTVIGIVPTMPYLFLTEPPRPQIFVPRKQDFFPRMTLAARVDATRLDSVAEALHDTLRRAEPDLPILNRRTAASAVSATLWGARIGAILLIVLTLLATTMAVTGIYSVTAYHIARRRREIAIRTALGAAPERVSRLIVGQTLRIVCVGSAAGLVLAAFLSRWTKDLLYGVDPLDPIIWGTASAVMFLLAAAASWAPARRLAESDPMKILREESSMRSSRGS